MSSSGSSQRYSRRKTTCWVAAGLCGFGMLVPHAAVAQSFTTIDGAGLEPVAGTWYENGVGAPSVITTTDGRYLMLFESNVAEADANCPVGYWAIGIASSTDGLVWTPSPTPLVEPKSGSYYSCVAAHPSVVPWGSGYRVYFKAEQRLDACAVTPPAWGCDRYAGVGYADVTEVLGVFTAAASLEPVVTGIGTFGFPRVLQIDGLWHMFLADVPDVIHATSADGNSWTLSLDPVLTAGITGWTRDELFNPAVTCDDTSGLLTYQLYVGGRVLDGLTILSGGWGDALSEDGTSWRVGIAPTLEWIGDVGWRHWDVLRVGSSDRVVWYSEKDELGKNRVRVASTVLAWDVADVNRKSCATP